jgi:hypothetical protein
MVEQRQFSGIVRELIYRGSAFAATAEPSETKGAYRVGMDAAKQMIRQHEARAGAKLSLGEKRHILKEVRLNGFY